MQITTDRFTLRPWRAEDATSLARHADNIRIWRNVRDCFPHPYTEEDARSYIGFTLSEPEIENLAIVIDGQAVGGTGIEFLTDVQRYNAELGYWLGEEYWGKGLMSEIIATVCSHIFRTTRINRIFAPVFDHNRASMRVLEKNGFTRCGIMHRAAVKDGQTFDLHYFELLKQEAR